MHSWYWRMLQEHFMGQRLIQELVTLVGIPRWPKVCFPISLGRFGLSLSFKLIGPVMSGHIQMQHQYFDQAAAQLKILAYGCPIGWQVGYLDYQLKTCMIFLQIENFENFFESPTFFYFFQLNRTQFFLTDSANVDF